MNKFIEELIGRLETQAEQYRRRGFEHEQKGYSAMADKYYGKQCSYLHSIEIVNGLAEKYINTSTDTSSGWISCSERLPEIDEWVLGQGTYDIMITCLTETYKGKQWIDINGDNRAIIAWMPLPAPFQKGE